MSSIALFLSFFGVLILFKKYSKAYSGSNEYVKVMKNSGIYPSIKVCPKNVVKCMLKYNINDLRLLYQGSLDILNQF